MYVHVDYVEAFVHVMVVCSFMLVHVVHNSCSRLLPYHAMPTSCEPIRLIVIASQLIEMVSSYDQIHDGTLER